MPAHDAECGARATHDPDSLFKQPSFEHSAIARILYRGPGQARLSSAPPDRTEGARAPGVQDPLPSSVRDIALSKSCGAPPARATRTSAQVRAHLRPSSSVRRNVVNGIAAPGRAFRLRRLIGGSPTDVASAPTGMAFFSVGALRQTRASLNGSPSASSWQAARIGHRAEPRRRPSAWEERSSPARGRRIRLHHQTPHR